MLDNIKRFQVNSGGYLVLAQAQKMGSDLLLTVWGGDSHIGAVAMAQPRPSLKDPDKMSATASVFCYEGHKDDEVAKIMAVNIAGRLKRKVVVAAGLHWDDLTSIGIKQVIANIEKLTIQIIDEFRE